LDEKAPIGLLLAAIDSLKFGFGALLLFSHVLHQRIRGFSKRCAPYKSTFYLLTYLLTLATTSGDLRRVFAGYVFRPTVAKSFDSI